MWYRIDIAIRRNSALNNIETHIHANQSRKVRGGGVVPGRTARRPTDGGCSLKKSLTVSCRRESGPTDRTGPRTAGEKCFFQPAHCRAGEFHALCHEEQIEALLGGTLLELMMVDRCVL